MAGQLGRDAGALLLLAVLAGCGPVLALDLKTGNVKVASVPTFTREVHDDPQSQTRFEQAVILPFDNGVGSTLPPTLPQQLANSVASQLSLHYPQAFQVVSLTPSHQPGELLVHGKITTYSPGNTTARVLLPIQFAAIAGLLKTEVSLSVSATGEVVETFSTISDLNRQPFKDTNDLIESVAAEIAERVAKHSTQK